MAVRHYETVFIITPVLSDQQIKETVEKFRDWLTQRGAEVYHEEHWGLRRMAYPIAHKSSGVYQLFEFKADPSILAPFEIEFKRDERVIRHLVVTLDKYGVAYNEKRRKEPKVSATKKEEEVKS